MLFNDTLLPIVFYFQVWEALGSKLLTAPIAAMVFHLSVGDTWNHINNVEKRLGVAVPVVFLVVSSRRVGVTGSVSLIGVQVSSLVVLL